ncbi:hypothetical protein G6F68_016568 [Rhizopus microsporus]|nr:hypothetical protein G6F68_016568 [Rhizopus microsporus]
MGQDAEVRPAPKAQLGAVMQGLHRRAMPGGGQGNVPQRQAQWNVAGHRRTLHEHVLRHRHQAERRVRIAQQLLQQRQRDRRGCSGHHPVVPGIQPAHARRRLPGAGATAARTAMRPLAGLPAPAVLLQRALADPQKVDDGNGPWGVQYSE